MKWRQIMNSGNITENTTLSPAKKPGRNLLCEILLFVMVYAAGSIGNLLITIVLLECLFLPSIGGLVDAAASGDPMELVMGALSSPWFTLTMLFATAATIVAAIVFCRCIQRRSWASIGLSSRNAFRHHIRGLFWGGVAISAVVAVCAVAGAGRFGMGDPASASVILLFFLAYLIQGASEEILCRGYFMYSIARRYPMWMAVVVSSLFFALLHLANNGISMAAFGNLFLFGVFAALLTIRTGSVWYASGFHTAWNFFQGNFFGIKVSGMDMHGSVFHFVTDTSAAWLNGGDFGMEGGVLCTALLGIGIVVLLNGIHRDRKISSGENSGK